MILGKQENKDKLLAALDFIRGAGASQVQVRFSGDVKPDIWIVVAIFSGDNPMGLDEALAEASEDPLNAAIRLCERLADGSKCAHCHKTVAIEADSLLRMPFDRMICWWQYDSEMKTFRRSCE